MNVYLRWALIVVGALLLLVGASVGAWLQWTYIALELTEGAFVKQYFWESVLSAVLCIAGAGCLMGAK